MVKFHSTDFCNGNQKEVLHEDAAPPFAYRFLPKSQRESEKRGFFC